MAIRVRRNVWSHGLSLVGGPRVGRLCMSAAQSLIVASDPLSESTSQSLLRLASRAMPNKAR